MALMFAGFSVFSAGLINAQHSIAAPSEWIPILVRILLIAGQAMAGLGLSAGQPAMLTWAMSTVPAEHSGAGSSLLTVFHQFGSIIGVGLFGSFLIAALIIAITTAAVAGRSRTADLAPPMTARNDSAERLVRFQPIFEPKNEPNVPRCEFRAASVTIPALPLPWWAVVWHESDRYADRRRTGRPACANRRNGEFAIFVKE
ncbi:hypothetical protein [Bifidobacterium vespertilionis]|uniref:hypothetical protein n=1 Tax=Bifidobacterium vespertilionis TaxID=2562524 RepID=UPI001BDC0635|nr:hypothetical protein [Bifidobacterium vespertilionis]MBT1179990.1 hypothetical protein [Bifidobacterium vespertilionis]